MAEHSYFVCCYGLELARRLGWSPGDHAPHHQLAIYLLRHDESECLEGDIPGPVKRLCGFDSSKIKDLLEARFGPAPVYTPEMKAIKKAADLIDECFYLAGELNSGNQAVYSSFNNASARLERAIVELPGDDGVKRELLRELEIRFAKERGQSKNIDGYAEAEKDWPTNDS